MRCWILSVGIILFGTCACKEEGKTDVSPIIPYKTGNRWTYESSAGGVRRQNVHRSTTEVGEYVEVDGNKGYQISGTCSSFLVRNDENGNAVEIGGYAQDNTLFVPSVRYKKNAIKGEKWIFNIISENCEHYGRYMTALFERISVVMVCTHADTLIRTAGRNFKCKAFSYSPDNGINVYTDFVSDGIGKIRTEHYENGELVDSNELVDYALK